MVNWKIAIGLTTTALNIGRSFEYIKNKYGFLTAILTHFGLSIGSCLALIDILYLEW